MKHLPSLRLMSGALILAAGLSLAACGGEPKTDDTAVTEPTAEVVTEPTAEVVIEPTAEATAEGEATVEGDVTAEATTEGGRSDGRDHADLRSLRLAGGDGHGHDHRSLTPTVAAGRPPAQLAPGAFFVVVACAHQRSSRRLILI
jgi:hypothetical protein